MDLFILIYFFIVMFVYPVITLVLSFIIFRLKDKIFKYEEMLEERGC